MTTEDEQEFMEFLRSTGDIVVLPLYSVHKDFQPVEALPDPYSGKSWSQFWLFNRSVSKNLRIDLFSQQRHYAIDTLASSVIEFSRSSVKDRMMGRGRIWADFTYFDSEKKVILLKEPAFKEWYETIARWIRKRYKHVDWLIYAGPGTQKFLAEGGKFDINVGSRSDALSLNDNHAEKFSRARE